VGSPGKTAVRRNAGKARASYRPGPADEARPHRRETMHDTGLVDREKRCVWVYYRARPQTLISLSALIGCPPA
jgi:hypothetical protein